MGVSIVKKLILICARAFAPAIYAQEAEVSFHGFRWGTSLADFTAKMGNPAHTDEVNGLRSLVYENVIVSDYLAFMVVYFSQNGLEGGTYYFLTNTYDELTRCYAAFQHELMEKYGSTVLRDTIYKEMAPYETSWNLNNGYIKLKVDTRRNDPVTIWYSSPSLTRRLFGS
jgi:hypothetical protein